MKDFIMKSMSGFSIWNKVCDGMEGGQRKARALTTP